MLFKRRIFASHFAHSSYEDHRIVVRGSHVTNGWEHTPAAIDPISPQCKLSKFVPASSHLSEHSPSDVQQHFLLHCLKQPLITLKWIQTFAGKTCQIHIFSVPINSAESVENSLLKSRNRTGHLMDPVAPWMRYQHVVWGSRRYALLNVAKWSEVYFVNNEKLFLWIFSYIH